MNLYTKNKNQRFKNALIGAAVMALFIAALLLFESPVKNLFYYAASPLFEASWKAGDSTSSLFGSLSLLGLSASDYSAVKKQNESLSLQVASLQDSLKQYQELHQAGQNTKEDNFALVFAQAIGQDTTSDFILINKGSQEGVSENMPVISSDKVLYGKISKVYQNFSQVMLVSNKNSVVDVRLQGASQEPGPDGAAKPVLGAIKGNGNFSMYLDLVASDASLASDDMIITSGQEGVFPRNLLIGKVSSIHKNDAKPFQSADVAPFLDAKGMENLFVITNYLRK